MNVLRLHERVVRDFGRALGAPTAYDYMREHGEIIAFTKFDSGADGLRVRWDNGTISNSPYRIIFRESEYA